MGWDSGRSRYMIETVTLHGGLTRVWEEPDAGSTSGDEWTRSRRPIGLRQSR
jgi:hypothetical protein